jgi:hypothetical protein
MTEQLTMRLSGEELAALKFAAHRQLARWAQKEQLSPRQHGQRTALGRAVHIIGNQTFVHGCELHIPIEE